MPNYLANILTQKSTTYSNVREIHCFITNLAWSKGHIFMHRTRADCPNSSRQRGSNCQCSSSANQVVYLCVARMHTHTHTVARHATIRRMMIRANDMRDGVTTVINTAACVLYGKWEDAMMHASSSREDYTTISSNFCTNVCVLCWRHTPTAMHLHRLSIHELVQVVCVVSAMHPTLHYHSLLTPCEMGSRKLLLYSTLTNCDLWWVKLLTWAP